MRFKPQRRAAVCAGLVLAATAGAARAADEGYIGQVQQRVQGSPEAPLKLPTDTAADTNGVIWIADGVNDRVVAFDPAGNQLAEVTSANNTPLHNPTGITLDATGGLWIADTGNHRVIKCTPQGLVESTLDLPHEDTAHDPDPTSLAVSPDNQTLWVVDNDNHRVLRRDLRNGSWKIIGRRGEALGQFQYPWSVAVAPNGDVIITDVINARLQLLNAAGDVVSAFGAYGVNIGELYRPSGAACDRNGDIWIADSVTGAVQVYHANGQFAGVLNDVDGRPMHFASPMGLAFDAQGELYVTELRVSQVARVRVSRGPVGSAPVAPKAANEAGQHARGCTICHLDWMPAFADGGSSSLLANPVSTTADPMVSRAETCLSCHNSLVADSRRRVWLEHGHRTGAAPPESMRVPVSLPLIDGKLACRTCHSAHRAGDPQADIGKSVFLRVENTTSELCKSCHTDKIRGPRFGTHPVTGMPWPVPQALIDAGAHPGPNPRELTCQVCHTPHGSRYNSLLVIGADNNKLCLTCHDMMRPGMFRPGGAREHPLAAKVNTEQAQAIKDMGTRLGPDGQLICLTCHKLHHGKGERFMLADDLNNGQMCLHCHSERNIMVGTLHDLRTNHPDERNRLGMTPEEGGPCSACHLFHRYARQLNPTEIDTAGQCTSCHQTGQCAQSKLPGTVNHPTLKCTECHNPHEPRNGKFLRATPEDLCTGCHTDKRQLFDGPHDVEHNETAFCDKGAPSQDRCLVCHRPHGDETTGTFRVAPVVAGDAGRDGACLACHKDVNWGSDTALTMQHPQRGELLTKNVSLPLVKGHPGGDERIGCRTCHNPHNGSRNAFLLRSGDQAPENVCTTCHTDMREFTHTNHTESYMAAKGQVGGECRPCHQLHANPRTIEPKLMFTAKLVDENAGRTPGIADDRYCLGCHSPGGIGPVPEIYSHPIVPMTEPPLAEGQSELRLFNDDGQPDPQQGHITCRTCHTPHGRTPSARASEFAAAQPPSTAELIRGLRLQVRSFEPPNLCSTCHGADALRRFLYFHNAERRSGPLLAPPTPIIATR